MIALWIGIGFVVLLLLLLLTPLSMQLEYDDTKDHFFWKVSYLWLTLFSEGETGLLQRKSQKEASQKKAKKEKPKKPKKSRKEIWQLFREIVTALPRPLKYLWKGISLRGLVIGVQVGCFDAKDCAEAYGRINGVVYSTLGLLQSMLRVQVKQVQVQCAFGTEKTRWILRGKIHVCPLAAVAALLSFLIGMGMRRSKSMPKKWDKPQTKETCAS